MTAQPSAIASAAGKAEALDPRGEQEAHSCRYGRCEFIIVDAPDKMNILAKSGRSDEIANDHNIKPQPLEFRGNFPDDRHVLVGLVTPDTEHIRLSVSVVPRRSRGVPAKGVVATVMSDHQFATRRDAELIEMARGELGDGRHKPHPMPKHRQDGPMHHPERQAVAFRLNECMPVMNAYNLATDANRSEIAETEEPAFDMMRQL